MSLITATLYSHPPALFGKSTVYRPENYRDKQRQPKAKSLTEAERMRLFHSCFNNAPNKKVANTEAIKSCLRMGVNTQPAIKDATGISQGTVCLRLKAMLEYGEVTIDRSKSPWIYTIQEGK